MSRGLSAIAELVDGPVRLGFAPRPCQSPARQRILWICDAPISTTRTCSLICFYYKSLKQSKIYFTDDQIKPCF